MTCSCVYYVTLTWACSYVVRCKLFAHNSNDNQINECNIKKCFNNIWRKISNWHCEKKTSGNTVHVKTGSTHTSLARHESSVITSDEGKVSVFFYPCLQQSYITLSSDPVCGTIGLIFGWKPRWGPVSTQASSTTWEPPSWQPFQSTQLYQQIETKQGHPHLTCTKCSAHNVQRLCIGVQLDYKSKFSWGQNLD